MRSTSLIEIRNTIAQARSEGAQTINLAKDGKTISEIELTRLSTALASSSTVTKYA